MELDPPPLAITKETQLKYGKVDYIHTESRPTEVLLVFYLVRAVSCCSNSVGSLASCPYCPHCLHWLGLTLLTPVG